MEFRIVNVGRGVNSSSKAVGKAGLPKGPKTPGYPRRLRGAVGRMSRRIRSDAVVNYLSGQVRAHSGMFHSGPFRSGRFKDRCQLSQQSGAVAAPGAAVHAGEYRGLCRRQSLEQCPGISRVREVIKM